jgi:hypothetical protein
MPCAHPIPPDAAVTQDLNRPAITALLDSCLLSDSEMGAAKTAEEWLREDPLFGDDD